MKYFFIALVSIQFQLTAQTCDSIWLKSFRKFVRYKDSVSYTTWYNMDKLDIASGCLSDTLYGIKFLGSKIFYGHKINEEFEYDISYLPFSVLPTLPRKSSDSNSSILIFDTSYSEKNVPTEMLKLFFITAMYEGNFSFKEKTQLGLLNDTKFIGEGNINRDKKLMKSAEKSLSKWIKLLDERGLEHLRMNEISPLYFSNLKWY